MMVELALGYPQYAWHENKGYAAPEHMDAIRLSVADPLGDGGRWWSDAESPWQCLATCREIVAAIDR